jgi:hypothetical protein
MLFLYAGLLYLAAIAVVLLLKPAFMFRPDGTWKEFGIGRNPKHYTPLPLWLYSIVAALVSYFVVLLISQVFGSGAGGRAGSNANRRNMINIDEELITNISPKDVSPELTPGYYVLNKAASRAAGIPKYVYIGKEAP